MASSVDTTQRGPIGVAASSMVGRPEEVAQGMVSLEGMAQGVASRRVQPEVRPVDGLRRGEPEGAANIAEGRTEGMARGTASWRGGPRERCVRCLRPCLYCGLLTMHLLQS